MLNWIQVEDKTPNHCLHLILRIMLAASQNKRKHGKKGERPRQSARLGGLLEHKEAQVDPIRNGVLYIDKARDGQEGRRLAGSLQAKLVGGSKINFEGKKVYDELPAGKLLDVVNGRRRNSQAGKEACYDVMEPQGSTIYGYSLPLTLMAGLLQGLKCEESLKTFKKETKSLATHAGTNYMFLHWLGTGEARSTGKDYHLHKFVKARPGLGITIESLGNFVSRRILCNPAIGVRKYPGILSNRKIATSHEQDFQEPHWDFIGWRYVKAEEMPWVVHVPICKEGMMLHIWPTQRDEATHGKAEEKFILGIPKLVYVAFGDYLILRADVCHGGCFGSKGNMRFHLVLRQKGCLLDEKSLHLLGRSGIDKEDYEEKWSGLSKLLGERDTYFKLQQQKKSKTVTAYCNALKRTVYPENETWTNGLLDNLDYE